MSEHFGVPGIGGSLGMCAICEDPFISEILFGECCVSFHVPGIDPTLYAHKDCMAKLEDIRDNHAGDWTLLPEGPLRRCFAEYAPRATPNPNQAGGAAKDAKCD